MKNKNIAIRIIFYLIGLFIIALGINVSKLATLGISPVSSIPGVLNKIFEDISFSIGSLTIHVTLGTMVIVVYCLLVIAQFIVLGKKFKIVNALGVAVGFVFGYMVDLVGTDPKALGHLLYTLGVPGPASFGANEVGTLIIAIAYLLVSIIIIGIGVYIYLKPELVPMPAEGLALAISTKNGKAFGNCKSIVDTTLIAIALALQIICLGGFNSINPLADEKGVVGIGTIVSALLVGQVVKFIKRKFH